MSIVVCAPLRALACCVEEDGASAQESRLFRNKLEWVRVLWAVDQASETRHSGLGSAIRTCGFGDQRARESVWGSSAFAKAPTDIAEALAEACRGPRPAGSKTTNRSSRAR